MSECIMHGWFARVSLVPIAALAALAVAARAAEPEASPARPAWTGSKLAGTPEPPPPYVVEPAFPKLTFERPLLLVSTPSIDRVFVGEQGGKLFSFPVDPACDRADLVIDLAAGRKNFGALYGMAFHPDFARNRQVFICYVDQGEIPDGSKVCRFRMTDDVPPRIDPDSEEVLLTFLSGGHNGGCLQFGPDGYLYISTGDATAPSPPDILDTGQDLTDLLSSILRIDVDHTDPGRAYRVPPDNPFLDTPGARPEIWAFGFRNPWRMSFDPLTGSLWVGDVGWELWEMVFRVERGGNYGWSVMEASQPVKPNGKRGPGPITPPVAAHLHSEAASVTGGHVSRTPRLPDLAGEYLYGDFQTGTVWGIRHDGQQLKRHRVIARTPLQLVSFGEDNTGEVYLLDYERTRQVYRLAPNPSASRPVDFPGTLSQTGLFASTADLTPAPGVVPYAINAAMWSDHARAERLLAIPGTGRAQVQPSGFLTAPEGSVLARTVWLELERGQPASRRRVETQVLHFEEGTWRPYSYVWNDDQTDAVLAGPQGSSRTFTVIDPEAPGGKRTQEYRIHARSECLLCHNPWVERQTTVFGRQTASPLAFHTSQLDNGRQLQDLERMGVLTGRASPGKDATPVLVDPYDTSADLDRRARSYLQVNCSHCHQSGAGGSATILLGAHLPLDQMNLVGARPMQGSFGIDDARLVAPGDPEGSVLYTRLAKLGGGRMPRVGSDVVDEPAVRLFRDWIRGMPGGEPARLDRDEKAALADLAKPEARPNAIGRLLESTRGALLLLDRVDRSTADDPLRPAAVAAAMAHPRAEVRDLFERFVPDSERVKRLGDAVDVPALLALPGDPERGRIVFAATASQCSNCHRLGGAGQSVGPDLDRIGAKYARAELLRHVLEPSLQIEPAFATHVVETRSGQLHTGLLVARTDAEVVLRDAQGQEHRIPAGEVEQVAAQPRSLMPEGLLRELTARQAADLIEFLATRK